MGEGSKGGGYVRGRGEKGKGGVWWILFVYLDFYFST